MAAKIHSIKQLIRISVASIGRETVATNLLYSKFTVQQVLQLTVQQQ